jgi:hypothetical protein
MPDKNEHTGRKGGDGGPGSEQEHTRPTGGDDAGGGRHYRDHRRTKS